MIAASTGSEITCSHLPASLWASAHDSPRMSVRKRSARRWRRTTRSARRQAGVGERDAGCGRRRRSPSAQPLDHLRDRRPGHHEPFGDAGLDDVDVVLAELEDRLAVLLERWVPLGSLVLSHPPESTAGVPLSPGPLDSSVCTLRVCVGAWAEWPKSWGYRRCSRRSCRHLSRSTAVDDDVGGNDLAEVRHRLTWHDDAVEGRSRLACGPRPATSSSRPPLPRTVGSPDRGRSRSCVARRRSRTATYHG